MKKSKCIKCDFQGEYTSSYGTMYNFLVGFESNDEGQYSAKSKDNPKFKVGEEAEYELETKTGVKDGKEWSFNKIKPVQQNNFGGGGYKPDTLGVTVGAAINGAVSLCANKVIVKEKITDTARWLIQQNIKLKEEFKDKL